MKMLSSPATTGVMTVMPLLLLLATMAMEATAFEVTRLTYDNYDELTEGKTVFIKFFAPWVSSYDVQTIFVLRHSRSVSQPCFHLQ